MKERIKNKWIKALKSGQYEKRKGNLCTQGKSHDSFCCLGVLTELYIQEYNKVHKNKIGWESNEEGDLVFEGEAAFITDRVREWAGLGSNCGGFVSNNLVYLNDKSHTFEPVIEAIEKHWEEM